MDWSKYYPANYTAITEEDIKMIKEMKNKPPVDEDASNDKSDDGEGMDKVDPKALKKKFKNRKDRDLDNDGDEDDSDEYHHAKRQAITKAIDDEEEEDETKESVEEVVDIAKETKALARVTRGKDNIAIEGAASLMKKGKYDDLASYLDKMQEEPRQSVMMVMMNDQKIADKVM